MNLDKLKIHLNASVVDALKKIDALPILQTIFVVDDSDAVLGSITDGDIRRGLIQGKSLDDPLEEFMFKEFSFLYESTFDFIKLQELRKKRLKVVPSLNSKMHLIRIIDFSKTKSLLPIDAVIMAGGMGSRLKPLTNSTPKPLLKVGGKEIISYNFDRLSQYGIKNQFITVNYLGAQLEVFCSSYNENISFKIIKESDFLGTAGALSLIPIEDFENETVLLMNSDLLTNIDYEDFYKTFLETKADILVASVPYKVNVPYAIFETDEGSITGFREKPRFTYNANGGIYLIKKQILSSIPKGKVYNATDLMEDLIASGGKLYYYSMVNYWLDIGKHEDFEQAQRDILTITI